MTALPSFFIVKCKWGPCASTISRFARRIFIRIIANSINIFRTNPANDLTSFNNIINTNNIIGINMMINKRKIIGLQNNTITTRTLKTKRSNTSITNSNKITTSRSTNINTRMVSRSTTSWSFSITKIRCYCIIIWCWPYKVIRFSNNNITIL